MKLPIRRLPAVAATFLAVTAAHAQAPTTEIPFTVDEAVRLVLAKNPSLAAAAGDVAAAGSGVRAARALANPEFTITPGFSAGGSDTELLVRQPLEINGARAARTGVAAAQLRQTRAEAVTALRDVVFTTKSAYYELARARALSALADDLLRTAEEMDRITRRQVEVGTRPGIEQTQTGIEVVRARQQAVQAESRVPVAQAALNTTMGRTAATLIGPLEPLPLKGTDIGADVDGDTLLGQALGNRAEIAAALAAGDVLRQQARQERAEGRPDLAPQFRAGTITRGFHDTGFGVGISLPLLDLGGRRGRVRQAQEAARAQDLRAEAVRNQVRQDVAQAVARYRAADAVVKAYPQGVLDQARRLLDASRVGFQAGQTNIVALLEAQRTFRSVQTEYTDALVDRALALAELERASGTVPATLLPTVDQERKSR